MADTTVNIRYNFNQSNAWEMQDPAGSGQWKGAPDYFPINVPAKQTPKITFQIVTSAAPVQFQNDSAAISDVAIASGNGKALKGTHSGQLDGIDTKNQGQTLVVKDKNSYPIPFDINYTLHFKNSIPDLDPVIKNGGDPPERAFIDQSLAILLLGAVILAGIGFFIGRSMKR